jgi:hypothetical protein
MSELSANTVLDMLRKLPPRERLKVIAKALPEIDQDLAAAHQPRVSLLGLWKNSGFSLSKEEIDQARKEMWAKFSREDNSFHIQPG